ncbi:hypothetical protein RHODGE_RHODGE_04000 [Rhodoplanes serenus]|uniref:GcrA cell cycle regulator n=1 Tax=Rhodoplanes serenus TaxID=200615 RepID=A0A447CZR8_9BRAD|nr:GcrA family cell cycle regulator [Rhodoplanes serenus]VCU10796.1 hypothetical protein RHODGE_RHODGE_04000 [Rhodoplanes serenus]
MTDLTPMVLHDAAAPPERVSAHPPSLWAQRPEAAERAIALYRDGASATTIMAAIRDEFGAFVTRSAVQGLMHRRGVRRSERHGVTVVTERMRAVAKGRPLKVQCVPRAPRPIVFGARPKLPARPSLPERGGAPVITSGPPGGVALLDLERQHCRWPLWQDDAPAWSPRRCCGARRRDPDSPLDHYCPEHGAMAFVPPEKRARRG